MIFWLDEKNKEKKIIDKNIFLLKIKGKKEKKWTFRSKISLSFHFFLDLNFNLFSP